MHIDITEKSIIGTRDEQQDASLTIFADNCAFAAVFDGMGGTSGGGIASRTTAEKMKTLYQEKDPAESFPSFFLRAIDILDESVVGLQKQPGLDFSGTTLAAAAIEGGKLYWLSVGDSRLYIIRGDEIVQVTRDHNLFMSTRTSDTYNQSDPGDKSGNYRGDTLVSFIGVGGVRTYDINEKGFLLSPGDIVLLTTDGLTKLLDDEDIMQILKKQPSAAGLDALFDTATQKAQGAQDNTTCIVLRII